MCTDWVERGVVAPSVRKLATLTEVATGVGVPTVDPWGRPYLIIKVEGTNEERYQVVSDGPDREPDTMDDLWVSVPNSR